MLLEAFEQLRGPLVLLLPDQPAQQRRDGAPLRVALVRRFLPPPPFPLTSSLALCLFFNSLCPPLAPTPSSAFPCSPLHNPYPRSTALGRLSLPPPTRVLSHTLPAQAQRTDSLEIEDGVICALSSSPVVSARWVQRALCNRARGLRVGGGGAGTTLPGSARRCWALLATNRFR